MFREFATAGNEDLVSEFIVALNDEQRRETAVDDFCADCAVARRLKGYLGAFPKLHIHLLDVFSERDLVVVRLLLDLESMLVAGEPDEELPPEVLEAIAVCRVEDGRIVDVWLELDVFAQVTRTQKSASVDAVTPTPYSDTESSRSLILSYLVALNGHRKTPKLIERFTSDEKLIESVRQVEAGFPGYKLVADEIVADCDRVAVRFHTHQRHLREFMGMRATGLELSITGIAIFRIESGKIVEHWLQADMWKLMQAIQEADQLSTRAQLLTRRPRWPGR